MNSNTFLPPLSWCLYIILTLTIISCGPRRYQSFGDRDVEVFHTEHLYFDPELNKQGPDTAKNEVIRIGSGRILLKKIDAPNYQRHTTVKAQITLQSAGDRWDKSGSCFVIPKRSLVNFLSISANKSKFPAVDSTLSGKPGVIASDDYEPVMELMRFMTPFGVGAYSDSMALRRPVYIPFWEKEVSWEEDVTPLLSELQGECWIGIWIDTWTKEGYTVSMQLKYEESESPYYGKKIMHAEPLVNTIAYMAPQSLFDIFSKSNIVTDFNVPENAKNLRLEYITTGHGGHEGGDEFTKQENDIYVDGNKILNFIPWRDDCASFRRFNPGSGVWLIQDTASYIDWKKHGYATKVIEERLASSDLSRSNWCPGSDVPPVNIPLGDIQRGRHQLKISIPNAQPASENKFNHWLVSAYLVWEE